MNVEGGTSPGSHLNRTLDSLGFRDRIGDYAGTALDAAVGNTPGVVRNLVDALEPISTSQLDRLTSTGLAPNAFAPKPTANYKHHVACYSHTHYSREQIVKGSLFGPGFDKALGTAIEKEIMANPEVRGQWETKLGGRVVYDGKADGTITVAKKVHHEVPSFPPNTTKTAGGLLGRTRDARMMNELLQSLAKFLQETKSQTQAGQTKGTEQAQDTSSILNDPSLSFEQKLAMFLFAYMEKKEKEISEKMAAFDKKFGTDDAEGSEKAEGKKKKKKGGMFGGIADKVLGGGDGNLGTAMIGSVIGAPLGPVGSFAGAAILGGEEGFGQYLSIGGGLLGGYYGGPVGATAGSQIGLPLGQIAGGFARGAAQDAFGVKAGTGGTTSATDAKKTGEKADSEQTEMKKLQMAVEEMNKMFTLIDNILKSMNDVVTRGPIAAIRG
jgi:hypothetical protein